MTHLRRISFLLILALCCPALPAQESPRPQADTQSLDYRILKSLQNSRTPAGNRFWVAVSNSFVLSPLAPVGIGVGALAATDSLQKESLFADASEAGASWLLNAGLTMGLKALVGRPRPWVAYEGDLVCLQKVGSPSFPSGHTSFAFVSATALSLLYPRWYVVVPSMLWAGAVGFSRMYVGAHYPSDVLAGALIGTGSALLAHWLHRTLVSRQAPFAPPPDAVVIPFAISF